MKLEDLKPGLYRLTRDVANPHPDRRQTYDWRAFPTWKAGTIYTVRPAHRFGTDCLEIYTGRWSQYDLPTALLPMDEKRLLAKVVALLGALEPHAPRTVVQALKCAGLEDWLDEALERLVAQGRLSLEDFVTAAREAEAEYQAEGEAK